MKDATALKCNRPLPPGVAPMRIPGGGRWHLPLKTVSLPSSPNVQPARSGRCPRGPAPLPPPQPGPAGRANPQLALGSGAPDATCCFSGFPTPEEMHPACPVFPLRAPVCIWGCGSTRVSWGRAPSPRPGSLGVTSGGEVQGGGEAPAVPRGVRCHDARGQGVLEGAELAQSGAVRRGRPAPLVCSSCWR